MEHIFSRMASMVSESRVSEDASMVHSWPELRLKSKKNGATVGPAQIWNDGRIIDGASARGSGR